MLSLDYDDYGVQSEPLIAKCDKAQGRRQMRATAHPEAAPRLERAHKSGYVVRLPDGASMPYSVFRQRPGRWAQALPDLELQRRRFEEGFQSGPPSAQQAGRGGRRSVDQQPQAARAPCLVPSAMCDAGMSCSLRSTAGSHAPNGLTPALPGGCRRWRRHSNLPRTHVAADLGLIPSAHALASQRPADGGSCVLLTARRRARTRRAVSRRRSRAAAGECGGIRIGVEPTLPPTSV